eukprot:TRINITY_DN5642_c0_g2_i1.p1 TRINITY_DN5642_c0_g2~~TRINITY_DN5642_c0_g2_i1.p1  ORF type:complete len:608 (-),score=124.88 TRINITY_DN5642_c0_g2_i1:56-1879(-)
MRRSMSLAVALPVALLSSSLVVFAARAPTEPSNTAGVRILQWNVFEDGLTDSPGNLGFEPDFEGGFSELLSHLAKGRADRPFYGFSKVRDFSRLPPVAVIDSTKSFFNFIDLAYSGLYHAFGGTARFGSAAPGDKPDLGNTLRTLFLASKLPEQSGSFWTTPEFEHEIQKAALSDDVAERVRQLREAAFDKVNGSLVWTRTAVDGQIWKRESNIWQDSWVKNLAAFVSPPADIESASASALSRFMEVVPSSSRMTEMNSILQAGIDGKGDTQEIRTMTFQAAIQFLLLKLCEHSLHAPSARTAISRFAHVAEVPSDADARMRLILPSVLRAVEEWRSRAGLSSRHERILKHIERMDPALMTLVEYDQQWQKLALPSNKDYNLITGKGTGAIMFDTAVFQKIEGIEGVEVPSSIPGKAAPKSSCVALLRHKEDSRLYLVVAIHMESGPPSDAKKVNKRALQLRAVQDFLKKTSAALAAQRHQDAVLVLGGDFNALPDEFIRGTHDVDPPAPALLRANQDGSLDFLCGDVELRERSRNSKMTCSRAGKRMVIDFIYAGSLDGRLVSTPIVTATESQSAVAADRDFGIYNAVMHWGSDHLPVGAEVSYAL